MPAPGTSPASTPIPIEEIDDPRVAIYRNQKDAWLTVRRNLDRHLPSGTGLDDRVEGLFMAEGELVVRQLVRSDFRVHSVLMGEARLESTADLRAALPPRVPVYVAPGPVVAKIVGFDLHRGVLAAGVRPAPGEPGAWTLERLTAQRRTLLVLEDLANHDNIGGIFRNAGALLGPARAGVVLSPRCADPLYRKALRVSIGQALRVPFARAPRWPAALGDLASAGYRTLALTPAPGAVDLRDLPREPGRPLALVLGAEGPGLTPGAMAACAARVRIPVCPDADSLNVATAAAVALHALTDPPA